MELAPVTDPTLVLPTIAQAIGISESGPRPLDVRLLTALSDTRVLLVIDNFEQVIAAARIVAALLAGGPRLKTLVTSRTPLRVSGEQEFPVPPLELPDMRAASTNMFAENPAIALFVQRARAVRPGFGLDEGNATAVAEVCRRLDGVPLAIELAAARSKILSPQALLARLTSGLSMLTGGPYDQPVRLQTMRAAIAWSYDLLAVEEQALFRRLAVFAGGFSLAAAEAISGVSGGTPLTPNHTHLPACLSILDGLSTLVDSSLVRQVDVDSEEPRFSMLETIREFGLEQLAANGEDEETRQRHASWFLAEGEAAWATHLRGTDAVNRLHRLTADFDNVRAAISWFESRYMPEALRLASSLSWFCYVRGHLRECLTWLERALNRFVDALPADRARGLLAAGLLGHFLGDDERAVPWLEASLEIYEGTDDNWSTVSALSLLGIVAEDAGDYERATDCLLAGLELGRKGNDPLIVAQILYHLGIVSWGKGDHAYAEALFQEALAIQSVGGDVAYGGADSLAHLGVLAGEQGDLRRSAQLQRESLELHLEIGAREDVAFNLASLAVLAVSRGQVVLAGRLFGKATALREEIGNPFKLPERAFFDRGIAAVRAGLDRPAFESTWEAGRALPLAEAIAEAMTEPVPSVQWSPKSSSSYELTKRELEVLQLLVAGKTDREIGEALFISSRTAQAHVAHIFDKLGVATRTAAVAAALCQNLISNADFAD